MRSLITILVYAASFCPTFLASGTAADTAPISISKTEKPGRFELNHWPERGWIVQQFGKNIEVRFPEINRPIEFEDRLGSQDNRVVDLSIEKRDTDVYVRFTLNCDCKIAVQGEAGRRVVFDILDPEKTAARRKRNSTGPVPETSPLPIPKKVQKPDATRDKINVEEARQRLMEQLLRAADAGIIDLESKEKPKTKADADQSRFASVKGEEPKAGPVKKAGLSKSASETKIDRVSPEKSPQSSTSQRTDGTKEFSLTEREDKSQKTPETDEIRAPKCFSPEDLQFAGFQTIGNTWQEISRLRRDLIGEFDRIDNQVAVELVRYYLSMGLVEEARALLTDFLDGDSRQILYLEIASILDGEPLPDPGVLRKSGCSEEQDLWLAQALALDGFNGDALETANATGRALERLPQHLRERAAAHIGMAAVRTGKWATAREMEALANRSAGAASRRSQELLTLSAALAKWHGEDKRHKDLLQKVLAQGGRLGDEALIMLAKASLQDDANVTSGFVKLRRDLGSLALRERGTPLGSEAFALEVKMRSRQGPREAAFDLIDFGLTNGFFQVEKRPELIASLVEGDLYAELERPLAMSYLQDPKRFSPGLSQPGFRQALVGSMIDVGVPALAGTVLREEDRSNQRLMKRLASALLDAGAAQKAVHYASSIEDLSVRERLLTEARLALGQSAPKAPVYDELPISDEEKAGYRLAGADRRFRDAIARRDFETALEAAQLKMALAPSLEAASQLAMIALEAGRKTPPAAVSTFLKEKDPNTLRAIEGLFALEVAPMSVQDQKTAKKLVEKIDTEISMIEEILGDG